MNNWTTEIPIVQSDSALLKIELLEENTPTESYYTVINRDNTPALKFTDERKSKAVFGPTLDVVEVDGKWDRNEAFSISLKRKFGITEGRV